MKRTLFPIMFSKVPVTETSLPGAKAFHSNLPFERKIQHRSLPMIEQKNISEILETSLIYLLSAAVAALGFLLVWLIGTLTGFGNS
jgi:hypothetical protein